MWQSVVTYYKPVLGNNFKNSVEIFITIYSSAVPPRGRGSEVKLTPVPETIRGPKEIKGPGCSKSTMLNSDLLSLE